MSDSTPSTTPESSGIPATPTAPPPPAQPPVSDLPTTTKARSRLALWAMIAGIVAIVSAIIPGLSFIAWIPALAALALGVIALVRKTPRRGQAFTGVILGPLAWIIAIVVSVGAIAGLAGGPAPVASDDETPALVDEAPASEEPEPSEEPDPAPEPEPEPEIAPPAADVVYEGVGDSVVQIALPGGPDAIGIATVSHSGARNFVIWALDEGLAQSELLVNTIGGYAGSVPFNLSTSERITALEITADGPWSVTLRDVQTVREAPQGVSTTGQGDDVLLYLGDATIADVSHSGERNFVIWSYGSDSELLVNDIGSYTGAVRWPAGTALIQVNADGAWSLGLQ